MEAEARQQAPLFYEPNVELLTVGTRVRISLRGECEARCPKCTVSHHSQSVDRETGVIDYVIRVDTASIMHGQGSHCNSVWTAPGHYYGVQADKTDRHGGRRGGWFAAVELTPLPASAPETEAGA